MWFIAKLQVALLQPTPSYCSWEAPASGADSSFGASTPGPTLLTSSLCHCFHILGCRKAVRPIKRGYVTCRRNSVKPKPQAFGQLFMERVYPDLVFSNVGVDYAGPLYIKLGHIRNPTILKAYVCVFVTLSVKAVHLEAVSDLSTEAFLASLRRFVARRGKPSLIWSDHGSNFFGATRELRELYDFLQQQESEKKIFTTRNRVGLHPRTRPSLWWNLGVSHQEYEESPQTCCIQHKLTFEELTILLAQVEACLNSRPLATLPCDDDGVEALTPGHFLIGRPVEALPDPAFTYHSLSLQRRWNLCQVLVCHFWQRWSLEYFTNLQKFYKWHYPSRNATVGDVVVLQEDNMIPTRWPHRSPSWERWNCSSCHCENEHGNVQPTHYQGHPTSTL